MEIFRKKVFKCITFVGDNASRVEFLDKQLPIIILNLSGSDNRSFHTSFLTESYEQGCGAYIIQTSPEKRIEMVEKLVKAKNQAVNYRYNNQRYLFLGLDENDTDLSILQHHFMFYMPNLLFITSLNQSEFVIHSHTAFDGSKLEDYEEIDTWSLRGGFSRKSNLYPDKIKNVKGRNVVFGLINYTPYSLIIEEGGNVTYDGLDVRLGSMFVEIVNGKWSAIDHPVHLWGTKFPNGSGNGVFGSVQSGAADMGFGGFYQWYCDILDCSYPYLQSVVTCLVPKPLILSGWMTIILPFTFYTWVGLITAFFTALSFVFALEMMEKKSERLNTSTGVLTTVFGSFYTIFRLQILQIPKVAHKRSPLATFIKISIFYYFFVAVFWQGGIASILTVPRYERPINSASDLVSKWPKVKWGAVHKAWVNSIENSSEPIVQSIVQHFVVLDRETLIKKTKTRDFGFLFEMLPTGHYGFSDYITEEGVQYLRVMENGIYTAFAVILLPRGSPYTEKFDNMIQWMFSTGIIQKIEIQVHLDRVNNHLQNMIRLSNEKEPVRVILAVRHIEGPIYIYLFGMFIAFLTLTGEKFLFWYKINFPNPKVC